MYCSTGWSTRCKKKKKYPPAWQQVTVLCQAFSRKSLGIKVAYFLVEYSIVFIELRLECKLYGFLEYLQPICRV